MSIKLHNYEETILNAKETTPVVVRKTWEHDGGGVAVQCIQSYKVATGDTRFAALTGYGTGMNRVTAIRHFTKEQFTNLTGLTEFKNDFYKKEAPLLADWFRESGVYDDDEEIIVNIEVTESFTPNPYMKEPQEPKRNPAKDEVIKVAGKAVYRHSELVLEEPDHQFVQKESDVIRDFVRSQEDEEIENPVDSDLVDAT